MIDKVSFDVSPGDFLSIVGPSGVGKSTLAKLGAGLLAPDEGSVSVAGVELSGLAYDELAGYVRLVPQDTFIQAATLLDNLTWGTAAATDEEIGRALAVAQLTDFVSSLPDGVNTQLGVRGATLSGGQRQRVAIARAVLAQPNLLILDESTSALDGKTERDLLLAIRGEFADRIVVLITHRPQAAAHASRTLEVSGGRLLPVKRV